MMLPLFRIMSFCFHQKSTFLLVFIQRFLYNSKKSRKVVPPMQHECRITDLETKIFPESQKAYLANSNSDPCPYFKKGGSVSFETNDDTGCFSSSYEWALLRRSVGYHRPLCPYTPSVRIHHAWLDKWWPYDDCLLQLWNASRHFFYWTNWYSRNRRITGMVAKTRFLQYGGWGLYWINYSHRCRKDPAEPLLGGPVRSFFSARRSAHR